jgi:hypothetical protein
MLKSIWAKDRLKRFVIGLTIFIVILGIVFLGLDILDIDEDYQLPLPINIFDTVFIFVPALLFAYLTYRYFVLTGPPEVLALSGAQLILGAGSVLKGWLPIPGLAIPITLHESLVMAAALVHLAGGILVAFRNPKIESGLKKKRNIAIFYYLGILIVILLITLLVFQRIIPSFAAPAVASFSIQDIMQESASLVFFFASFIYFIIYLRSPTELHYWYFLGLLLFAFGVLFVSMGHLESRIAWLGRFSEYSGNFCFIFAIIREKRRTYVNQAKESQAQR